MIKKISSYRENTLKSSLNKISNLRKKIYSHELKNKQLNDVEAIAVTEIPKNEK